jgi:NADH:ubiquinone oxidoreductase subunit 4 (subunit M)
LSEKRHFFAKKICKDILKIITSVLGHPGRQLIQPELRQSIPCLIVKVAGAFFLELLTSTLALYIHTSSFSLSILFHSFSLSSFMSTPLSLSSVLSLSFSLSVSLALFFLHTSSFSLSFLIVPSLSHSLSLYVSLSLWLSSCFIAAFFARDFFLFLCYCLHTLFFSPRQAFPYSRPSICT